MRNECDFIELLRLDADITCDNMSLKKLVETGLELYIKRGPGAKPLRVKYLDMDDTTSNDGLRGVRANEKGVWDETCLKC